MATTGLLSGSLVSCLTIGTSGFLSTVVELTATTFFFSFGSVWLLMTVGVVLLSGSLVSVFTVLVSVFFSTAFVLATPTSFFSTSVGWLPACRSGRFTAVEVVL